MKRRNLKSSFWKSIFGFNDNGRGAVSFTVPINLSVCLSMYLSANLSTYPTNYPTHQLLAYADDVNILGGSIKTVKENAEALVVATKEIGMK